MNRSDTTLDLFAETPGVSQLAYREAMDGWLAEVGRAGRLQRESSVDVYEHMWSAMAAWAVGNGLAIDVCWRRFKIEPPCRSKFEPGLDAVQRTVVCG